MTDNSSVFSCSTVEALYLAALLGGRNLVGFADPFFGWLAEEVEPELNAARERLTARGVLEMHPNGSATLHDPAAALLRRCLSARASLLLSAMSGNAVQLVNYHLTDSDIVVHMPDTSQEFHELWLSRDAESLIEQVMAFFPLQGYTVPDAHQGGTLPEAILGEARTLAAEAGAAAACALLEEAGLPASAAAALAGALAEPAWNGSMVGVVRSGPEWEVEGAAFLAGAGGLWQLRPAARSGESLTEVVPCTPDQACEELRGVLRRVLAAPGQTAIREGF